MFIFSGNTNITENINTGVSTPVLRAMRMLERDRDKKFYKSTQPSNAVVVMFEKMEKAEQYKIIVFTDRVEIHAGDDLGMIYGLLHISEHYLEIQPFWFYMDQQITQVVCVSINEDNYISQDFQVRFRGWFMNDEVLMMKWKYNKNGVNGWEMAMEALLRCGGNMVIPGTDRMARKNRKLASDMGLWITHHHAEPLGAEMFAREYPDVVPDFLEHEELFVQLWEKAIVEQKDSNVVWNLCFRGQGDMPFWANDTSGRFDTPKARGKVIGDVISKQYQLVKKYVENPVFCTNLYGEIMELYGQGYLELPDDIIKVRADNGFGKMVTRRQNNHNPRLNSMPNPLDNSPQGIYYHVSFYDLQAANHITMLPNSVDFVNRELSMVLENGGSEFWVINASNIRPHVYFLDAVRKKWCGKSVDDKVHSQEFATAYFDGNIDVAECYRRYPKAMISYGRQEDEHMGEQYYTENVRVLVHQFLVDRSQSAESLFWLTGKKTLEEQVKLVCEPCEKGLKKLQSFQDYCIYIRDLLLEESKELFEGTIYLQTRIHSLCAEGTVLFGKAYEAYQKGDYVTAFMKLGDSARCFDYADLAMKQAEYGVWEDFYKNDCLADIRHTAYMVRKMMGLIRELGDSTYHDKWYHQYCCAKEDRGICLLMFTERHMTDMELYLAMRRNENDLSQK